MSRCMPITASDTVVLFDLGNVLVRVRPERGLAGLKRLAPEAQVDEQWLFFGDLASRYGRGELGPDAFFAAMGRALGVADTGLLRTLWCDVFDRWPEMEALAASVLGAGHRVYLASNTDPVHFEHQRRRMPVLSEMHGLHLSYEVGLLKPAPAFFTAALDRFGLVAEQCVFLDDLPANVAAARAVGMRAQVFDGDVEQAQRFLLDCGVRLP